MMIRQKSVPTMFEILFKLPITADAVHRRHVPACVCLERAQTQSPHSCPVFMVCRAVESVSGAYTHCTTTMRRVPISTRSFQKTDVCASRNRSPSRTDDGLSRVDHYEGKTRSRKFRLKVNFQGSFVPRITGHRAQGTGHRGTGPAIAPIIYASTYS